MVSRVSFLAENEIGLNDPHTARLSSAVRSVLPIPIPRVTLHAVVIVSNSSTSVNSPRYRSVNIFAEFLPYGFAYL